MLELIYTVSLTGFRIAMETQLWIFQRFSCGEDLPSGMAGMLSFSISMQTHAVIEPVIGESKPPEVSSFKASAHSTVLSEHQYCHTRDHV